MDKSTMLKLKRSSLKFINMANELLGLAEKIDSLVAAEERQVNKEALDNKDKVQKPVSKKKTVAVTAKEEPKNQTVKKELTPVSMEKPKAKRSRPAKKGI